MAHLNRKGPEEKGPETGRKLGLCVKKLTAFEITKLGVGEGKKRHDSNCKNSGKRIHSGKNVSAE